MTTRSFVRILLVEDNPGDVELTRRALRETTIPHELEVVEDGEAAISILDRLAETPEAPDLVLLDLNLPRRNGREVLAHIKATPSLRRIPVVMLTSSQAESDVHSAYDLHANSYVVKPVGVAEFLAAVQQIESYWIGLVERASRSDDAA